MVKFTVVLTDAKQLAGMTAARLRYNASLPKDVMPFYSDAEYVQFMVQKAAERYAQQLDETAPTAPPEPPAAGVAGPASDLESQLAARIAAELDK